MIKEFKEFIARGNVMDMAVGIVVGGAFTAIVNSLVNDIIMPLIGIIIGGVDFSQLAITVGNATFCYGNFIQAIINFLLIALTVFLLIKSLNKLSETSEKVAKAAANTVGIKLPEEEKKEEEK